MLDRQLFPDETPVERIRMLENIAEEIIDEYWYDRVLTDEELAEEREIFATLNIELRRLEEEKKALVEEIASRTKPKKTAAELALTKIQNGRENIKERVYELHDHVDEKIGIYNNRGELIHERPMPGNKRKQGRLFSMQNKVVNE